MRRAGVSPNEQLRAARALTASPQAPGEPLSRQELAECVNTWIFDQADRVTEIDGNYIGKLERGVIRWPQACYRDALRAILRAETDRELGFHRPRRTGNGGDTVDRQQFLRAAAVVSAGTIIPLQRTTAPSTTLDPLACLREAVTTPPSWSNKYDPTPGIISSLEDRAREAHRRYQTADYDGAARLLPDAVLALDALVVDPPVFAVPRRLHETRAVVYLAVAKLAAKVGDHDLAWVSGDRAHHSAMTADLPAMTGAAYRQIACVFHETGRLSDAERVALTAADSFNRLPDHRSPDLVSACGALLLLAAMTSARMGDRAETRRRLDVAADHANALETEGNRLWSAFGPTNVAIHSLSVALAFDDPAEAIAIGARIDTSALPLPLVGRRAQVHVDLAGGHARLGDHATATVHVLEVERIAPQALQFNAEARELVSALLVRARGSTLPVLRGIADRAGITV